MARPSIAAVRLTTGEREPCRLATTANIELEGLQMIDGVMTEVGDRILVKNQSDASENGIRTASAGTWYRASDARSSRNLQKGTTVHIQEGTANAGNIYSFQTINPVVGDDDIVITLYLTDSAGQDILQAKEDAEAAAAAAAASQSAASTSATNASNSASSASTSATNASNSASTASTAATNAGNSATSASNSASAAQTAENNAETAEAAAEAAQAAAEAAAASINGPMIFQGTWSAAGGTFPAGAFKGFTYIVSVAGTVGGQAFEVNDQLVALIDAPSTTVYAANWYRLEADLVQSVAGLTGTILAPALRSALATPPYVATRTALKALSVAQDTVAFLTESGREGLFRFVASDLSTLVAADTQEGLYVAPNSDSDGSSGAWVRQRDSLDVYAKWFGAVGDTIEYTGSTSITSGAATLTVTGASFTTADVGKRIIVPGAGAAGATLATTILSRTSATQVTLAANAGTTLSSVSTKVSYGTDDLTAINKAILALPVTGGTVWLNGAHITSGNIELGNGTSSTVSTRQGIRLKGEAPPPFTKSGSYSVTPQAKIVYAGAASGKAVEVKGPLIGWEVSDLWIDGGSGLADNGLYGISASRGETWRLTFSNCKNSYHLTCYSGATGFDPDISANTDHVRGGDIVVHMPNITSAIGFLFDGATDGTASTCFVNLDVIRFYPSTTHANYGIIFKVADTVVLNNILGFASSTVHAGSFGAIFDYGGHSSFPCHCVLDNVDIGWNIPAGQQFANSGSAASAAAPNLITRLSRVNGCRYPRLANVVTDQTLRTHRTTLAADSNHASNVNTAQAVFPSTQDAITLKANTLYEFEGYYIIARGSGTTSHNTGLSFGGTATITSIDALVEASNGDAGALGTVVHKEITVATNTVITAANTSATESVKAKIKGEVRIGASGGTFIPQFQFSAAPGAAPVIRRSSHFTITELGPDTMVNSGDWA